MNRARCPECNKPTVPDRDDLRYDEMLCDFCYYDGDPTYAYATKDSLLASRSTLEAIERRWAKGEGQ